MRMAGPSELDVWRSAKLMIDYHGDQAEAKAVERSDEAVKAGDIIAFRTWKRVARAIRSLNKNEPSQGEPQH